MHKYHPPWNLSLVKLIVQLFKNINFKVDKMTIKGLKLGLISIWIRKEYVFIMFKSFNKTYFVVIGTLSVVFFFRKDNVYVGIKIMGAHFLFWRNYFFFKKKLRSLSINGVFFPGETKAASLLLSWKITQTSWFIQKSMIFMSL